MDKRKKVKKEKRMVPSISLEEELKEEVEETKQRRAPVTQVVEVVDEKTADDVPGTAEEEIETPIEEKEVMVSEDVDRQSVEELENSESETREPAVQEAAYNEPAEEEKRKEMVDELFAGRTSAVTAEISAHKKKSTKPIFVWALVTIIVAFVVGGGLLLVMGKGGSVISLVAAPTPTPTPIPSPTATPTPEDVDRSQLRVQVLNGGGVSGAAGKMKTLLEEKGYTVTGTGNAKDYTYEQTEILVKADKEAFLKILEGDLADSYTIGTNAATLDEDAEYDALVTVGKE